MNRLDDRFVHDETVEFGTCASLTTASTPQQKSAFVLKVGDVTTEALAAYCSDHEARMKAFSEQRRGRILLMIYDLTGVPPFDWKLMLNPLIQMKTRLKQHYMRHLLCTIIIVDSSFVRQLLTFIFSSMYESARPLRIMDVREDVVATVATLWQGQLLSAASDVPCA
jgi:hypothetical protein